MTRQQGRGGMGMRKHGKSGHPTRSPKYKHTRTREDNAERAARPKRKPLQSRTVREAMEENNDD